MTRIYLDNAATTPMDPDVIEIIYDEMKNDFGNASTLYKTGRTAKSALERSREVMAKSINAKTSEIVITSGGSESNNNAIISTADKYQEKGKHVITTAIEHESVLKSMQFLETKGFEVTYLKPNKNGIVSAKQVQDVLRDDTILVSIMAVNNEVGSVMPIKEIGDLLVDHQAKFHTDAVQAYGIENIDVQELKVDLLSTSAHKINGPKFIGFLYIREDFYIPSYIHGGEQEKKRRAGTENIPGIVGFAKAIELNEATDKQLKLDRFQSFKTIILKNLSDNQIEYEINGNLDTKSHVLNIWVKGVRNDLLLQNLDLDEVEISAGSACTAGSLEPSHVLMAIYDDETRTGESIRISFGKYTTEDEIKIFNEKFVKVIKFLLDKKIGE